MNLYQRFATAIAAQKFYDAVIQEGKYKDLEVYEKENEWIIEGEEKTFVEKLRDKSKRSL